ncbi:MAG: hypothetical protein CMC08_00280 [Flavobacteriaceae bacterium]|jgi:hypothetical protein|nr:hypothetical protein [Flavobacteriaceae bacterium]|tara:strand:+ start:312 stop:572 length:261 start_codon:yes stop_codon:yes gene_type:complete
MTSEEFMERFQSHPLGWVFQSMETAENETQLERYLSMAHGMILLLEFQKELSEDEASFLNEAARGNAKRNYDRVTKTNFEPPSTRQ